jgi:hypothetical protein
MSPVITIEECPRIWETVWMGASGAAADEPIDVMRLAS